MYTNRIHLNNNGNISPYRAVNAYTPWPLVGNRIAMMAPFFADVYTLTQGNAVTYGSGRVNGRKAWCANWLRVGYYGNTAGINKNSFQLCLIDAMSVSGVLGDFDMEVRPRRACSLCKPPF